YGIDMTLDLATDIDSLPAQIASFYVKQEYPEQWLTFDEAIFNALWQDGRDIGDVEVLKELAEDTGIDADEIELALDDETLREQL
ncbi:disulfide bond formation protein DsbA, partial [Enterococcus hirae]